MHDGVALAARDQVAVDEEGEGKRDGEAAEQGQPEERIVQSGLDRTGDEQHDEVVDASMTAIETVSAARAVVTIAAADRPARMSGIEVSR